MNKPNLVLMLIFGLLFVNSVSADIPPPPVAQEIRIELDKNYTDYQFYLCSYKLEVKPNPNPPHPSRPNMIVRIPDSFELKKIELSYEKPYSEALGSSRIQYRGSIYDKSLFLVAVEKSKAAELESKIQNAIDSGKSDDKSIRFVNLEESFESRTNEGKGVKVVVNKISLDDKGMTLNVEEGTAKNISGKTANCIGLGLLFAGIALFGGWWTRKRFS